VNASIEDRGLPGDTNVNSRGPTTFLWIKHLFGFCGELWWFVVDFWLLRGWLRFAGLFLLVWGAESVIFLMVKTW
jgi:hypothetical protein